MNTDFLAGSKGIQVEGDYHYETIVDSLLLSDDAVVHVSDNSGSIPLIWQKIMAKVRSISIMGLLALIKQTVAF